MLENKTAVNVLEVFFFFLHNNDFFMLHSENFPASFLLFSPYYTHYQGDKERKKKRGKY